MAGSIYTGGLLEGGIDLTALELTGCFSSFMAETRSSPSISAQLKDFVLGTFESCGATITTQNHEMAVSRSAARSVTPRPSTSPVRTRPDRQRRLLPVRPRGRIATCDADGTFVSSRGPADAAVNGTTTRSPPLRHPDRGRRLLLLRGVSGRPGHQLPGRAFPTDSAGECFTVTPAQPTILTVATSATPCSLGTVIDDTATLGGTANDPDGNDADGTITFTAYGPFDALNVCTGDPVYTSVVAVSGDGDYTASDGDADGDDIPGEVPDDQFIPTAAGTYNWIAVYSGDPRTPSASTACAPTRTRAV